ncbi:Dihydroxyacetone kinase 2 [Tulasnella sp. JGI-2019a]|nr:Dihydroxyacetone kinase 2 [Tulasnella sp. JGI-2019a]
MVTQKHLCDNHADLVVDSLKGLCASNPSVGLDEEYKVLYNREVNPKHVSVICGGGSGHEPAHAGMVGDGLLAAAVCGNIYASPNVAQIRRAIELVGSGPGGALLVVKNYTGDVLNFGLASEQAKASGAKADVRVVIVGDDVSVGRTQGGLVGRRGLAGTVLVYKIAAALARSGASLSAVEAAGKQVAENVATIGVGLEHCHVPGTGPTEAHLAADEVELGMGIHNEPGFQRIRPAPPLTELMDQMMKLLTSTDDKERSFLPFKHDGTDEVVLLVNNLGGISELEMGAVAGKASKWFGSHKIKVQRMLVGTYMTSLNMPGVSVTVLLLPRDQPDTATAHTCLHAKDLIALLDEPANAPGWRWHARSEARSSLDPAHVVTSSISTRVHEHQLTPADQGSFLQAIKRAAEALVAAEPRITRMDQIVGDGDAGLTLKAGAEGVLLALNKNDIKGENVISDLLAIADVVEKSMGGTSGALYSIFLSGLVKALRNGVSPDASVMTAEIWVTSTKEALGTLMKYTRARPPSRTLMDPLTAFVQQLPQGLSAASQAARDAANETKSMAAKAGRSAYLDQKELAGGDTPDPGAWGVAILVTALEGDVEF